MAEPCISELEKYRGKFWLLSGLTLIFGAILWGYAAAAGYAKPVDIDVAGRLGLIAGQSPQWLILFMQGISWIGGGLQRYVMVTLLTLVLWHYWGWRAALALGFAALFSSISSDVLKLHFDLARPDIVPHLDHAKSASYPSGHATNAMSVYLTFTLVAPPKRRTAIYIAAFSLIFLTGLSRMMLGVHWPSDIIGGYMLGGGFALIAYALYVYRFGKNSQETHS